MRIWCLTGLWLIAIASGLGYLTHYRMSPGSCGAVSPRWPEESRVALDRERLTLVMFAHPRCSCTWASLSELAGVVSESEGRLAAHVVFLQPPQFAAEWSQTSLWREAIETPGISVLVDQDGREARRFGVATSGQVALYSPDGELVFEGGITPGRAHEGDNQGRRCIEAAVSADHAIGAHDRRWHVYGCPLFMNGPVESRSP